MDIPSCAATSSLTIIINTLRAVKTQQGAEGLSAALVDSRRPWMTAFDPKRPISADRNRPIAITVRRLFEGLRDRESSAIPRFLLTI